MKASSLTSLLVPGIALPELVFPKPAHILVNNFDALQ